MTRLAVFGYGSLVSRESIAETLGHEAAPPMPAVVAGWRRRWSIYRVNTAHEKVFERVDGKPFDHVVGLNLERAPRARRSEWPNGALIEVTESELERLDRREMRYDRIDVTQAVIADGAMFERVYAFTAKKGHLAAETPPGSIIIASYVRACEAAFEQLERGGWERFLTTTGAFPAPVVEATLVVDGIPNGNPRAW